MTSVIKQGKIEQFDDLHIDQIDPQWKNRKFWITAGLEALQIATDLRSKDHFPVDVALTFSLTSGETPRGAKFHDSASFEAELDWSPPSLHLLKPGKAPWEHGAAGSTEAPVDLVTKKLDPARLGFRGPAKACYFMEFKQGESSEYARTVLFVG